MFQELFGEVALHAQFAERYVGEGNAYVSGWREQGFEYPDVVKIYLDGPIILKMNMPDYWGAGENMSLEANVKSVNPSDR
jgi:hypothetical protein